MTLDSLDGVVVSESARGRPAPGLRPFIAWYHGYRQRGVAPAQHRGLPSPYLTVIFTLDEPLHIAQHVNPLLGSGSYDSLVGGLHTAPALITHQGAQSGIQLLVSPLGARALFALPAGELAGIDLDGGDVLGGVAAKTHERLRAAATWPQRFAVLDEVLLSRLREERPGRAEVEHAWQRVQHCGGTISVAGLAREVGWSERHLANRFRAEIGLTPKAAARVTRFDRARRALQAAGAGVTTFADVAADCGYYDQSHLTREFIALAGCAPGRWLAEEFGNIQASSAVALEDSAP